MGRLVDQARGGGSNVVANDVTLRFETVSRSFGEVKAVAGVSFELRRGEILTLLGPSGCGKTTTLRMAIGLERCDGGRILYRDAVVDSPGDRRFVPPEKREMGMVFQSYAIWPHMSVKENVAYPLRYRRLAKPEITRRVEEVLEVVGLGGLEDRRGTQLSGGQQQRVAVARGIVSDPDVLLMDEPFSNLDAKLREQMRGELKRLQRRLGISTLFVTHDQSEALALSDRIAVMKDGRIEQIGDPVDLYAAPETAAVRDFLGRSILMPGRIVARNGANTIDASLADGRVVKVGGGDKTRTAQVGDSCLVAVRPESILVEADGAGNPKGADTDANAFEATIQTILFMGESYEADVELPGGQMALINLSPTQRWREGQRVRLMLPPEKLQVWDFEAVGEADG